MDEKMIQDIIAVAPAGVELVGAARAAAEQARSNASFFETASREADMWSTFATMATVAVVAGDRTVRACTAEAIRRAAVNSGHEEVRECAERLAAAVEPPREGKG